jgi:hypothetical protein
MQKLKMIGGGARKKVPKVARYDASIPVFAHNFSYELISDKDLLIYTSSIY